MEVTDQISEMASWLRRGIGNPFIAVSSASPRREQFNDNQSIGSRIKGTLIPLLLVQLLGFSQALNSISAVALMNNAVVKPILQFLVQCLMLSVFANFALIRTYGMSGVSFIYEARSWLYLCYTLLDFIAYKLQSDGSQLMPRYYNIGIPILVTLLAMVFSGLVLKNRFKITHIAGFVAGILGIGFAIWGDQALSLNYFTNAQKGLASGIVSTIFASIFKALGYLILEASLRHFTVLEIVACYGTYGLVLSFLEMAFLDSYEFVSVEWNSSAAGYLVLSSLSMCGSLILTALVTQQHTATLASMALFTSGPWYIGLCNLGFALVPAFPPTFQHVVGYLLVLAGQIIYLLNPIFVIKDITYKLDFYRRPQ